MFYYLTPLSPSQLFSPSALERMSNKFAHRQGGGYVRDLTPCKIFNPMFRVLNLMKLKDR